MEPKSCRREKKLYKINRLSEIFDPPPPPPTPTPTPIALLGVVPASFYDSQRNLRDH